MSAPREDLLYQATPAVLHKWCGSVLVPPYRDGPGWTPAVLVDADPDEPDLWNVLRPGSGLQQWMTSNVRLDMSRRECRDRVAEVAARATWPDADFAMTTAPRWFCHWTHDLPFWTLSIDIIQEGHRGARSGSCVQVEHCVAGLDPADNERLSDGSRVVDALALMDFARAVL